MILIMILYYFLFHNSTYLRILYAFSWVVRHGIISVIICTAKVMLFSRIVCVWAFVTVQFPKGIKVGCLEHRFLSVAWAAHT